MSHITHNVRYMKKDTAERVPLGTEFIIHPPGVFRFTMEEKVMINGELVFRGTVTKGDPPNYPGVSDGDEILWGPQGMASTVDNYKRGVFTGRK